MQPKRAAGEVGHDAGDDGGDEDDQEEEHEHAGAFFLWFVQVGIVIGGRVVIERAVEEISLAARGREQGALGENGGGVLGGFGIFLWGQLVAEEHFGKAGGGGNFRGVGVGFAAQRLAAGPSLEII